MNDYLLVQVCLALESVNFFEELQKNPAPQSLSSLSKRLGVDATLLEACTDFLWSSTDIINKDDELISLNEIRFKEISWAMWMMMAYKPVFDNMGELLKSTKKYGHDLMRDGEYLQKASFLLTKNPIKKIITELRSEQPSTLVDFGCGSAYSLILHCQNNPLHRGIGIDIDASTIQEAMKHVAKAGLEKRIQIIKADVIDIDYWQRYIPREQPITFLASTILHEFLLEDENLLICFFKKIKSAFPQSHFFVHEHNMPSLDDIKSAPNTGENLFAASYALWHPFTNQGKPQAKDTWEKILQASGWHSSEIDCTPPSLILHCIQNKKN